MTRKKRQRNTQPKDQPAAAQIRHSVPGKRLVPVILVLLSLAVVLTVVRIRSARAVKEGQYRNYNVLLITLDTTRADHLPAYGYTALRAPNLDRFAGESFVFDDAFAQVPLTLPSHVSMMTGRLPISHGVRDNAGFVLNQKEITLAEILKGAGYATGAFVSAAVVESQWQLNQGFDTYDDRFQSVPDQDANPDDIQQRRAGETEARFEDWLQSHRDGKFLAWVHYYDPHDPYDPPEPYKTEYASHPYDGEIAYTDEIFGKLMATLEAWHLKDRTIIVLTADHGEGLGEHNEQVHGMFLYNTTMHVPLFIYVPGSGSRRIDGVVRHIDLAPTILDLLGMETPAEMQGVSLIGKINGTEKKSLVAYGESLFSEFHYGWSPLVSATTDDYRYIRAPRPELYDRKADPGDTRNAIQEKAPTAKVLERELGEIEDSYTSLNPSSPQKMDPETQEKLAALGYIGGGAQSTEESRKIDPKDKADVARRIQEASGLVQSQMYKQALETLAPVLQSDPDVVDAHYIAGLAYFRTGNVDAAVNELLKTVQLRPDDALALYNLGYAYDVKGRFSDAEFWYLKSLEVSTDHLSATLKLAHLYRRANEPVKAKSYFLAAASLSLSLIHI